MALFKYTNVNYMRAILILKQHRAFHHVETVQVANYLSISRRCGG